MPEGHVYILGSETGILYTGVTSDFDRRLWEPRNGLKSTFATRYGCKRVLLHEQFTDIRSAIAREKEIKGWTRAKKLALIAQPAQTSRIFARNITGRCCTRNKPSPTRNRVSLYLPSS